MSNLHAVIMAGGSGTRFWPASRTGRPKQFLPLAGGVPLLQATIDRLHGVVEPDHVWIVTNPVQAASLPGLLPDFPSDHVLVEPEARDTAPCVALATAVLGARDPDATMALLPADHVIAPTGAFHALLRRGADIAADGTSLVTFGIAPDHPATGYGYIETGDRLDDREPAAFEVRRFREKPDRRTAEQFVADGGFLWNSGIFVWSRQAILSAMEAGEPGLHRSALAMEAAARGSDGRALEEAFRTAPRTSIDYAVMERAPRIAVVRAELEWNDLGSFLALDAVAGRDDQGQVAALYDGAKLVQRGSRGCTVYAEGERTVALLGAEDLVVVAVEDAVLVMPRRRAGELKDLVEQLRAEGRTDLL